MILQELQLQHILIRTREPDKQTDRGRLAERERERKINFYRNENYQMCVRFSGHYEQFSSYAFWVCTFSGLDSKLEHCKSMNNKITKHQQHQYIRVKIWRVSSQPSSGSSTSTMSCSFIIFRNNTKIFENHFHPTHN